MPAVADASRSVVPTSSLSNREKRFTLQIGMITAASVTAAYGCARLVGSPAPHIAQLYLLLSFLALVLVGAVSLLIYTFSLLARGEARPLRPVWMKTREYISPAALANRVLPILLVFMFLGAFSVFKTLIPSLHPFAWDAAFSNLDRLIFGTDPWRLTHAIIGPEATGWIDKAYLGWMPVFACVVFWQSVFAPFEQKRRFFLAFFGCWLALGVIAAILFSSAGPCFLGLIGHPYADRYSFFPLQHAPNSQAVMIYLADGYSRREFGMASGISAMPSMHIAVVTLYLLIARKPWTVTLSSLYFVLIFVGSIHLGWHYAVDGIAAAMATIAIYAVTAIGSKHAGHQPGSQVPLAA